MSGLTREIYKDGLKEGRVEGRAEGSIASVISLFKKKLLELKDAAAELGVSEKEFLKMVKMA